MLEISYQTLVDTSSAFRANISKMKSALDEATNNINKTNSVWQGQAADELRAKYNALKEKFEAFYQTVERFARFLDGTAEGYKGIEAKIQQAANDIFNA